MKSNPITKVDASQQLSANQVYSTTWQVKGSEPITTLNVNVPGRIFVAYASDVPSAYDVEVKVSGSTEDVVKAVNATASYHKLYVDLAKPENAAIVGQFLLVEIRVRSKNSMQFIDAHTNGDIVVLDNVIASVDPSVAEIDQQVRRLQSDDGGLASVNAAAAAVIPSFLSSTTTTSSSSSTPDFAVTEDARSPAGGAKAGAPLRSWMISNTSSKTGGKVSVELGVPGYAVISELRDMERRYPHSGRVMVFGDDGAALDQVEVVSTHTLEGEKLQVRLKSTASTTSKFTTLVGITDKFQVTSEATSTAVQVRSDTLNGSATWNQSIVVLGNFGAGNYFVSAPDSSVYTPRFSVDANNGTVQVDIGKVWVMDSSSLRFSDADSSLSWFGEIFHSAITAYPGPTNKLCINTKYSVHGVDAMKNKDRVAYTGQDGVAKVKCAKRALPERVPAKISSLNMDEDGAPLTEEVAESSAGGGASADKSASGGNAPTPVAGSASAPAAAFGGAGAVAFASLLFALNALA